MTVRRLLALVVGLAVGALCLWLAFRGVVATDRDTGVSWQEIGALIRATAWWGHLAFAALMIVQFILRTERWRLQVRGLTGTAPPFRESLAVNAIGSAAIFLLPFRLGEFVRPNLAKQKGWLRTSAGLAGTVIERVVDGIVTTGFFGVLLVLMRDRDVPTYVRLGGVTALLVFGGAMVFFFVAFRFRAFTLRTTERALSAVHGPLAKKVGDLLHGFLEGLACFKRPRDLFAYVALSVAYWLLNALSMWIIMLAMNIDAGLLAAFFCLCFLVIGMMMPAPPGNVGNFHAFARAALTIFGVSLAPAVAYAIVLHAESLVVLVLWTAVFFVTGDLSLSRVRHATETTDAG